MPKLLSQYLSGGLAYYSLRNALKDHYRYIVEGLDSKVVDKDDIPIPPVLPTIPAGEHPIGAGRLDREETVESVDCLVPSNQDAQEQQQEGEKYTCSGWWWKVGSPKYQR